MASIVKQLPADADRMCFGRVDGVGSPDCGAVMRTHFRSCAGAFVVVEMLHQHNVNVIGGISRDIAINGFSVRHVGVVRVLDECYVTCVFAFSQTFNGAAIGQILSYGLARIGSARRRDG